MKRIMVVLGVAAFISCQKDMITPPVAQQLETQRITCDPLFFGSLNELQQAINNWSGTLTKGAGAFTSYANTVMQQEGYGDEPWALASSAFGSILNPDGEVLFEDKILKLGKQGILIGPASQTEEIRFLMNDTIFSLCEDETLLPYVDRVSYAYPLRGFPGIFFIDSFCLKEDSDDALQTKATDVYMTNFSRTTSVLVGKDAYGNIRWTRSFSVPSSGSQKTLFTDTKYCNDWKFYQQDYGVSGSGIYLRTKTMKQFIFWGAIDNIIEEQFGSIVVKETAYFPDLPMDINYVTLNDASFVIATVNARSDGWQAIVQKTDSDVLADIQDAYQALAQQNPGANVQIAGVRYVLSNSEALIRFPDIQIGPLYDSEMNNRFLLRLGGNSSTGSASFMNTGYYSNVSGSYYIMTMWASGRSFMGNEIRGSGVVYTYDYD